MKIHCPYHEDANPSMHCYPEYAHCFVCNKTIPINEVMTSEELKKIRPKEKENIAQNLQRILELPKTKIRGLQLHTEKDGSYYVVWPDKTFYKHRVNYDSKSRYIGPRGHRPPLFVCNSTSSSKDILVVCEGEANTLSLELALNEPRISLVSPGSANEMVTHLSYYLQYKRIVIVVDKDAPGVYNGLMLRYELAKAGKIVDLMALETDFNDLLQQGGPELVRKTFMKELGI